MATHLNGKIVAAKRRSWAERRLEISEAQTINS